MKLPVIIFSLVSILRDGKCPVVGKVLVGNGRWWEKSLWEMSGAGKSSCGECPVVGKVFVGNVRGRKSPCGKCPVGGKVLVGNVRGGKSPG